ncbi:hypothetical protein [Granulicella arctica]|uniref:hypothetical protein n=1 Tax=Granulicella arctica TaxID=940613 RepID=UPI0021DFF59F|nr:hypothetical protein [Granulicella arctica]
MLKSKSSMMKCVLNVCLVAAASAVGHAQIYKLHNADVGIAATGQFTTPLTSNGIVNQNTTMSPGLVFTLRDHPVAWAGVELNYGFTRYSQRYTYTNGGATGTIGDSNSVHEATAAYLFHPHFRHLQPFVGIGGGALDFMPTQGQNQWRGAGLLEAGLDIPTRNPHFGFRVQGRSLYYRAPNFDIKGGSSQSWVVTTQPSGGAYIRF